MANVENFNKVIALIENENNYFRMDSWNNDSGTDPEYPENVCGTPSCIGGWAEAVIRYEQNVPEERTVHDSMLCEWLNIDYSEMMHLFFSSVSIDATREEAINHLKSIADGGKIDWKSHIKGEAI